MYVDKKKILYHYVERWHLFPTCRRSTFGPTVLDDVAFGPLNQGLNRDKAYQIALQQLERLNIVGLKIVL